MEKISLEDEFEKDLDTAVDFEITLAALLSASILVSPRVSEILAYPTLVAGISLLALTLIRQMGIINEFSKTQLILNKTSPVLIISTTYAVFYTAYWFSSLIASNLPVNPLTVAFPTLMIAPILGVALYEMLYQDFFILMSAAVYNEAVDLGDNRFRNVALRLARRALSSSVLSTEEHPTSMDKIRSTGSVSSENQTTASTLITTVAVSIAVLIFTALIFFPGLVVLYVFPQITIPVFKTLILSILFALSVNLVIVSVRFLYGRYGRDRFNIHHRTYIYHSFVLYVLFIPQLLIEQGRNLNRENILALAVLVVSAPVLFRIWKGSD
jgi:hypothetical protein